MKLSRKTKEALSNLMAASRALQKEEGVLADGKVSVEEYLPGGVQHGRSGQIYVHEKLRSEVEKNTARVVSLYRQAELSAFSSKLEGKARELEELGRIGFSRAVFLDIESTGLFNCPTFLVGIMFLSGDDFVIRQLFARDYSEEKCLVEAVSDLLGGFEAVITFNGKSYDLPFMADRAVYHGTRFSNHMFHFDLLHHSRRHWRGTLPNCRLQTLELYVCRRRRVGDIPGSEIPNVYHTYVRTGDPYLLVPVFHHNVLDLITMSELLAELMSMEGLVRRSRRASAGWRAEMAGMAG
ncbi:MAG: ribonuclease H-like domain-containing protein [Candidatus Eiseniibacteriota bacterium]|nr:MAG: ribonuclease H-like domain-containing protein [Candidatus Eisenbacteria bacterium]